MGQVTHPIKNLDHLKRYIEICNEINESYGLLCEMLLSGGDRVSPVLALTWEDRIESNKFQVLNAKKYNMQLTQAANKVRKYHFDLLLNAFEDDKASKLKLKQMTYKRVDKMLDEDVKLEFEQQIKDAQKRVKKEYSTLEIHPSLVKRLDKRFEANKGIDNGLIFSRSTFTSKGRKSQGAITRQAACYAFTKADSKLSRETGLRIKVRCHGHRKTHARQRMAISSMEEVLDHFGWESPKDAKRYTGVTEGETFKVSRELIAKLYDDDDES